MGRNNGDFFDGACAHNESVGDDAGAAMKATPEFDGPTDNVGSGSNIPGVANPGRS